MSAAPTVFLVEDDPQVLKALSLSLRKRGLTTRPYASAEAFLDDYDPDVPGCLVLDVRLTGMNGLALQQALNERDVSMPIIFVTGFGDIPSSVRAIKGGAVDFLEKPVPPKLLLERIDEALQEDALNRSSALRKRSITERFDRLTDREREVLSLLVEDSTDNSNKAIANKLDISPRTVESHRFRIMEKTQAKSIADLAAMARIHSTNGD